MPTKLSETTGQAAIVYRDFQNGMNDSVSDILLPDNYLRLLLNCYTDESDGNKLGDIKQIGGYSLVGSQIESGKNILGLSYFSDSTNTARRWAITTVNNAGDTNSLTYYWNESSWQEIGPTPVNWTAGSKMRFTTFTNLLFAANGSDTLRTWDGDPTSNWGTTNATSAPTGSLIINYFDRVLVSGNVNLPSRIYYSSLPDSSGTSITWDTTNNYIDVNPDDNDSITALSRNGSNLLIFKKRGMFVWFDFQSLQADTLYEYGAVNQEVVQTIKGNTIWFGETLASGGVFLYAGEYPQEISRPIRGIIDSLTRSNYDSFSSFIDDDNYYLSVGDVTYNGITYNNMCLRYNISKQTWSTLSLANQPLVTSLFIDTSDDRKLFIGDDNGNVIEWGSGNTFAGSGIESRLTTKELDFGARGRIKNINSFYVHASRPQGSTLKCRIDGKDWKVLGKIEGRVTKFDKRLSGNFFEFEIGMVNSNEPFIIDGFEFFDVDIEEYER